MKFLNIAKVSALMILVSISTSSMAYVVDTIYAQDTLADSGDATELAWVRDVFNDDSLTINFDDYKYDADSNWSNIENDVWQHSLLSDPAYYMVKFGGGGLPADVDTHYIYENLGDLSLAIIDLSDISEANNWNIGRVSHIVEFDSSTDVPEPATLLLMGLGLVGLGAARRKKA